MDSSGSARDLHSPKPLRVLIERELVGLVGSTVASLSLRAGSLRRATFIHPRARLIRAGGIALGGHCQIHAGATIRAASSTMPAVIIDRYAIIRENAYLDSHGGSIHLGEGVFVGQNAVLYGQGRISVGRTSLLSPGVTIISAAHTFNRADIPIKFQEERLRGVCIGEDCWLGANVVVLDGVTIGDGSVVGAGSVVTHDIEPGVVAHGVPAEVRRSRPH